MDQPSSGLKHGEVLTKLLVIAAPAAARARAAAREWASAATQARPAASRQSAWGQIRCRLGPAVAPVSPQAIRAPFHRPSTALILVATAPFHRRWPPRSAALKGREEIYDREIYDRPFPLRPSIRPFIVMTDRVWLQALHAAPRRRAASATEMRNAAKRARHATTKTQTSQSPVSEQEIPEQESPAIEGNKKVSVK